ncbi:MAG: hypothetical protein FJX74_19285 [Armatimonadetes bacterium]|nr:hypothetical protein [Armatimonadota bacterium]
MSDPVQVVELSDEELDIVLRWAERATRGVCPGRERYLSEAEARLLARLESLHCAEPDPKTR